MLRFLFICFILVLSRAESSSFWFNIPNPPLVDPNKPMNNLKDFINGFFDHFNLHNPSQIMDCFSRDSASLFFEQLQESYDMVTYVNKKYALAIRSEFFKRPLFLRIEPHAAACIALTEDLSNLFQKLGISMKNPKVFSQINFLYYQAHYDQLLEDFYPVISSVTDEQFYAAGDAYARLIEHLVYSVNQEGLGYLSLKGLLNGVAVALGLENLSFSSKDIDSDTAEQILLIIENIGRLSSLQDWEEFAKVRLWIQEIEEEFRKNQSARAKELRERLGMNVFSSEFYSKFSRYAERHELNFKNQMKLLSDYVNHLHMIQAGEMLGKWIREAAASNLEEVDYVEY